MESIVNLNDKQAKELYEFAESVDVFDYMARRNLGYDEGVHLLSALQILEDAVKAARAEALRRCGE